MTLRRLFHMLLVLLLATALGACTPTRGGGRGGSGDDDDDAANDDDASDDDDATGDDDDDNDDDDDDDDDDDGAGNAFAETTFGGTVTVLPGGGAQGTFIVRYWENLDAQLLGCQQTLEWNGTTNFGFSVLAPDCNTCTGNISINTGSVTDVSDPTVNPDDCSQTDLTTRAAENWGDVMTNIDGGFAWLEIPLLDVDTATAILPNPTNGGTLQETIDNLDQNGLALTHVGFAYLSTTILGPDGFDLGTAGANPPETGADLGAFWTFFVDPNANTFSNPPAMEGPYFMGSFWLLQ